MSSVTVDELVMRISVELDKFRADAGQAEAIDKRLRKSLKDTEKTTKDTGKGFQDLGGKVSKSTKELNTNLRSVVDLSKKFVQFFAILAGSNAVQSFASNIAKANDQLAFMSKRMGMSVRDIKAMDTAVAMLGGDGASAADTMRNLNQGIQEMVTMGNDALIPFFSALGVGVVDSSGKVRDMDAILLDMADSFSSMDPKQAYAIASAMGLDDGMANALLQGRDALQETLGLYDKMYVSSEAQLRASRELSRAESYLSAQWEGLKTMIGDALIPNITKMVKLVSGWMEFLHANEKNVIRFFEGLSIAIGIVLLPILVKAGLAMLALISPILLTVAAVTALTVGFGLLYDDYKTWAAGGKSLFDWGAFAGYIDGASLSLDGLMSGLAHLLTGYKSFSEAGDAFIAWLEGMGILTEAGFSIENFGKALLNLGADALASIKPLQTIAELIGLLMQGDFTGAAKLALEVPAQVVEMGFGAASWAGERLAGAVDVALGHDPAEGNTLAGATRLATGWVGNKAAGAWEGFKGWAGLSGPAADSSATPQAQTFDTGPAAAMTAPGYTPLPLPGPTTNSNTVEVSVGTVNVQTTATTLPEATAAGVAGGIERSSEMLNQLGGGLR